MDIGKIVKGIGLVTSAFNPTVGSAVIGVSNIVENLDIDDEILEKDVKGLSAVVDDLSSIFERNSGLMLQKDVELLQKDIRELQAINQFIKKFQKIVS